MPDDTRSIKSSYDDVDTASLDTLGNEPVPSEIIRDTLVEQWMDVPLTPRPEIHVLNDDRHPGQADYRARDWLTVIAHTVTEKQRGFSYEYKDVEVPVTLHIVTMHSRQRLFNLMAEARRIIYENQRHLNPYQQLYWDGFTDLSEGEHKVWEGECSARLTSVAVPVFKGVTGGMGGLNLPPDQR